jgi:hypothetical protein
MRYIFLVLLMSAVMVGLITWSSRPDLIEQQYDRVAAPIKQHFAKKRAAAWQAAREQAWHKWMARAHLPGECIQLATALRSLECRNVMQAQANAFERDWKNRIAGGWRPEGVD